jgi:hypothetical protein
MRQHPINRTLPNARTLAVKPTRRLPPHTVDKHPHPFVRRIQNRRIAPRQPPQIPAIHVEILRSLNDVAEMLAESPRRLLVAQMRQRRRPLRKRRHQRSTRLGRLGLQSGPRPLGSLEIRLVARIFDNYGFTRRPPMSRSELTFAQVRFKPLALLHRAPQGRWLEPQWRLALQHRAQLWNTKRSTLPDAQRITTWPNSTPPATTRTNDIVKMQPQRLRPSPAGRANKQRPCPSVRKLQQTDADNLLDMAEFNKECLRRGRDDVRSP